MKPIVKKPENMPPKAPKVDPVQAKFESEIERKIEKNQLFIKKLQ
jgi:hypothetical protein